MIVQRTFFVEIFETLWATVFSWSGWNCWWHHHFALQFKSFDLILRFDVQMVLLDFSCFSFKITSQCLRAVFCFSNSVWDVNIALCLSISASLFARILLNCSFRTWHSALNWLNCSIQLICQLTSSTDCCGVDVKHLCGWNKIPFMFVDTSGWLVFFIFFLGY